MRAAITAIVATVVSAALVGCASSTSLGELSTRRLSVGGVGRVWYEFRPAQLPDRPSPLVILLHGYGGKALDLLRDTGIAGEARRDGFIIASPQGLHDGWNAGDCCGAPASEQVDDVKFVQQIIAELVGRRAADPGSVFVVGYSNGGMLAYRLGCSIAGQLAGVAVVEATMTSTCPPHRDLNLLVVHQLADQTVPFAGGTSPLGSVVDSHPFLSVAASVATWQQAEGCAAPPSVSDPPVLADPVQRTTYVCPSGIRTQLDVMRGGSHAWPAGGGVALDATSDLATFFGFRP